jgi:4-alpha-glucanotransferase
MDIHFYIKYSSVFGETLYLRWWNKKETEYIDVPMQYLHDTSWHLEISDDDLPYLPTLKYDCYKTDVNGETTFLFKKRVVDLRKHKGEKLDIIDELPRLETSSILYTKPFRTLLERGSTTIKKPADKNFNVVFRAALPPLPAGKAMCITGSSKKLNQWNAHQPLLMYKKDGFWTAKLNLGKEKSIEYKYAIYDLQQGRIETYEEGNNRILHTSSKKGQIIVHEYPQLEPLPFKGAGINVHLMSLRSEAGWGTGTFNDLITLSDWTSKSGFKMIQLLPVNDTISLDPVEDSYPYAAISAFALHPYLLDIRSLMIQTGTLIDEALLKEAEELNALETIDYARLYHHRMKVLKKIYEHDQMEFRDEFAWFDFFDMNREWLVPYAVFCYLRDKYQTIHFDKWQEFAQYDEAKIQAMTDPDSEHYNGIAFYYFLQFHLHLQFKNALYHVHKNEMVLKGDLPIGVGRWSVETWMYPELFHMDQQSGAPPDVFSSGGQNWGFPTYNWERMKLDGYFWWKKRLEQMSVYFDAVRIDHVIGLARIWSIPLGHTSGELGIFNPSKGFTREELESNGVRVDDHRLCEPFINDAILHYYFHSDKPRVEYQYLEGVKFKSIFQTSVQLHAWLQSNHDPASQGLKQLMSNVIFIKRGEEYHFRMNVQSTPSFQSLPEPQKQILDQLYHQYFGERQDELWRSSCDEKLSMMKSATNMMLCAEDLGMVPKMIPELLQKHEVLSLFIERMPHHSHSRFESPQHAPYLSVVTPSTHDMEPLRLWWKKYPQDAAVYYHEVMGYTGEQDAELTADLSSWIVQRQMESPAMWVVFLLQDILAMDNALRISDPGKERINDPGNDDHVWNYRMHLSVETLADETSLSSTLLHFIQKSGRA